MALPSKIGLYDPANEHDACGVGFVANIKGRKSHDIVKQGLQILVKPPAADSPIKNRWRSAYTDPDQLVDPWQNPLQYSLPGANGAPFALYSFGSDGKKGGEGYEADVGLLPP